jgi:hypothetical protein
MEPNQFEQLLEKIRAALRGVEGADEKERKLLQDLEQDIRGLSERKDRKIEAEDSMLERLKDAIDHFEVEHPTLTAMISELSTILSNAGI